MFPALIQWDGPHPAPRLTQQGVTLRRFRVRHPRAQELAATLAPWLDAPLVTFEEGAPGFSATFDTPGGAVTLK